MVDIQWPEDPNFRDLARAIAGPLQQHLAALDLPLPARMSVTRGGVDGPLWTRAPDGAVALHDELAGPAAYGSADLALRDRGLGALALDRWRLAIGALMEAACHVGSPDDNPPPLAVLADHVDRAAHELGWCWRPALDVLETPEGGASLQSRRGLWWVRWATEEGVDLGTTDPATWLRFWTWVRGGARGLSARLPVYVAPSSPRPESEVWLAPRGATVLSRGGRPAVRLSTAVWPQASADNAAQDGLLVVSVEGGPAAVLPDLPGPVGTWRLDSGSVGGAVGAARGVSLELTRDGVAELVAADAWLGMVHTGALDDANRLGVSGASTGRWTPVSVAADLRSGTLSVRGLSRGAATVHSRGGGGFAMPGGPRVDAVRAFLQSMEAAPLPWRCLADGRLELRLPVGGALVLYFSREH